MSLTEQSRLYPGHPPQQHPYPPRIAENYSQEQQPTLPSMSSLLSRHERMDHPPRAQNKPYPSLPYTSQAPQEVLYPLHIGQIDHHAPPQLGYQPVGPPPTSQNPQYRRGSFLVSSPMPGSPPNTQQEIRGEVVQTRQHKSIAQRQVKAPTTGVHEGTSVPALPHNLYQPPPPPPPPVHCRQEPVSPTATAQFPSAKAMNIAGLLSGPPRLVSPDSVISLPDFPSTLPRRAPPKYSIRIRQQPIAARACGFGERDRRVIDPPPILQMSVEDPHASANEIKAMIRQPCAVVHCTLWDPVADKDDTAMPGTTDKRQQRRLMGTLVSSPFVGQDEHNAEGCFFTFPDLSVRTPGTYSLRFSLMIIDPNLMRTGHSVPVSSVVFSSSFQVYNAKDFGGMRPSTELTKRLKHQGCLISVKKGNARTGSNPRDEDDDDEEYGDAMNDEDQKSKRPLKRAKR